MTDEPSAQTKSGNAVADALARGLVRTLSLPVVDLDTGHAIGWEVLTRVGDGPEPNVEAWFEAADGEGLELELQVSAIASATSEGAPPADALVFVNVSSSLVERPEFVEHLRQLGPNIVIDLQNADRDDDLAQRIEGLQQSGVHLAVDDTTASTLELLARIRPAFVKLDASLVRDIDRSVDRAAVVAAYVGFAQQLDIHLVAEGIERVGELEALRQLGVQYGQGHLFGLPAPGWPVPKSLQRERSDPLDSGRQLQTRLAAAVSGREAAEIVCDRLAALDLLPSVYLARDGLLRCVAERGYWQVLDGVPMRFGLMAKSLRQGEPIIISEGVESHEAFVESVPGLAAEAAIPINVEGRLMAVLNVESSRPFTDRELDAIRTSARALEAQLMLTSIVLGDSSLHRLARVSKQLSVLSLPEQIEYAAPRLACEIAGFNSAMLALPDKQDQLRIRAVQGALAPSLQSLSPDLLRGLVEELEVASSCVTRGPYAGHVRPVFEHLREAGGATVGVFPVRSTEVGTGMLLIADFTAIPIDSDLTESLELFCDALSHSLDRAALVADLKDQARKDPLTGLGNQAAFQEAIASIGGRRRGRWGVVMADIDGFKAINDTYGHPTGDRALRELGSALADALRLEDRMYRVGGDEFSAVLHDVDAEGAGDIGRRLCSAAHRILGPLGASLSVGIALPTPDEPPAEYLERADRALYSVKRRRPGGWLVSDEPDDAVPEDDGDDGAEDEDEDED